MLQYRLYGGGHLPTNLEGFVKAGANIGSVIGQFAFGKYNSRIHYVFSSPNPGYMADAFGRKAVCMSYPYCTTSTTDPNGL